MHSAKTSLVLLALAFSLSACLGSGAVQSKRAIHRDKFDPIAAEMHAGADRQFVRDENAERREETGAPAPRDTENEPIHPQIELLVQ